MSRWRCSECKTIIDNVTWHGYPMCPSCGKSNPCEEWPLLNMDESELLWCQQELDDSRKACKQLLEKLKEYELREKIIKGLIKNPKDYSSYDQTNETCEICGEAKLYQTDHYTDKGQACAGWVHPKHGPVSCVSYGKILEGKK